MMPSAGASEPNIAFYLAFGSSAKGVAAPSGQRSVAIAGGKVRLRVLVVDDEDLIADSVAEILNRNGYDATARYSGKTAIQYVEEECPDIVVSDVIMPDYNGIQLARAVHLLCPETRIVLLSGNIATSDLLHRAYREGQTFELLAKPVHPVELLKALGS
jgi:CheY-like chemotaxis protein